jgi:cytochrome b
MNAASGVKVWDLPTRLFHWSIVFFFVLSWRSAESGAMDWHYMSGLIALGLVVFRLIWGVIGSSTARFSHFLCSPGAALAYLRDPADAPGTAVDHNAVGHNPVGGYSVVAMLMALSVQVGTGLFAVDIDGLESGPLSYLVSFDQGRVSAEIHELSFNLLLGLIGLHLIAIAYYRIRRSRKLIVPMITGRDPQLAPGSTGLVSAGPLRFVVAAGIAAGLAWWASTGLAI